MSAVPQTPLSEREKAWKCDGDTQRVRLRVEEEDEFYEIPTIEVRTKVTEGISSRDTFTRAKVPVEWEGYRVVDLLNSWGQRTQNNEVFDVCLIEWYDEDVEEWELVQTGWLRGISGTDEQGVVKLVISGFEQILSEISASKNFSGATYSDVINYISKGIKNVGLSDVHNIDTAVLTERTTMYEYAQARAEDAPLSDFFSSLIDDYPLKLDYPIKFNKNFKSNEHTFADVLNYFASETNDEWYFNGAGDLIIMDSPDQKRKIFTDSQVDFDSDTVEDVVGDLAQTVDVINNNALMEISPIQAAWVKGDTVSSIGNALDTLSTGFGTIGEKNRPNATSEYPFAAAWYPPLMANEPSAESMLPSDPNDPLPAVGKTFDTSHTTIKKAENAAKKKLKKEITTVGEGDMRLYGKPFITPKDKIKAYPVQCGLVTSEDVFEYNVESVTHMQSNGGTYETLVDCTVYVDETDIEVASTTLQV